MAGAALCFDFSNDLLGTVAFGGLAKLKIGEIQEGQMTGLKGTARHIICVTIVITLVVCLLSFVPPASAQTGSLGQNAVYYGANCCTGTSAFADALAYSVSQSNIDICATIYYILTHSYPSGGEVIDARGLSGSTLTCSSGTPWLQGGSFANKPSTILLPVGIITIPQTWVMPSNTHVIGQGDNATTTSSSGTMIKTKTGTFTGGAILQFGDTSITPCCSAISVENLSLNGLGSSHPNLNGIVNQNSQDFSYVDHVGVYQILGTGLVVSGAANDSGPYSNITFDTGNFSGSSSTTCASINGVSTRGIRGLRCTSVTNNATAAILLDASNNTIEDVRLAGFVNGVFVGNNASAQSNVLVNVEGNTAPPSIGAPIYVVHIANAGYTVSNLTIMGTSAYPTTYSIFDDVTGIHLSDSSVGMYALGGAVSNGHALFTTSPNAPSWASGTSYPTGGCAKGSLYSCSGTSTSCNPGGGAKALWGCPSGTWSAIK
jgi:hypothetical protein